jgi:hypothetical protein
MRGIGQIVDAQHPSARAARVWSAVRAARRVADPRDPLGREARRRLPQASQLSPEGVDLALRRHLETDPRRAHVDQLVAKASAASRGWRCWVVLAANVCTAPLRAIAWATASAPEVLVRPSRRDPVLAELLIHALSQCHDFARAGGRISMTEAVAPVAPDELHLYGSDQTIQTVRAATAPGVRVRGHGTGIGVALVERRWRPGAAAEALADDLVAFDQRGCLSPRFVLVEGTAEHAARLGLALHQVLDEAGRRVPRGPLDPRTRGELTRYGVTAEALGHCWSAAHHLVALDPRPRALLLPPAARCVLVAPCGPDQLASLLGHWLVHIAAIGGWDQTDSGRLARRAVALAPGARRSELGAMQIPPLDGPVDLRHGNE